MAGPAPKPRGQRRRRNEPERGEWIELAPLENPEIPEMPKATREVGWADRVVSAWEAWWSDPVSTQWTVGDKELVTHLADVYDRWLWDGGATLASEIRQLRDHLGLTPKGRQDRRWRVIDVGQGEPAEVVQIGSSRDRLKAVDPDELP